MKLIDVTKRAGRSLTQSKTRTILTSLAIAVGAFTITLALAAGEGGRQFAEDIISSNTDVRELYVQPKDSHSTDPTKPQEYSDGPSVQFGGGFSQKMLSKDDIKRLSKIKNVDKIEPIYNASALYVTRDGQKKYQAGLEPQNSAIKDDVIAGSTNSIEGSQVILPSEFAKVLGLPLDDRAIGKSVTVVVANAVTDERKSFELEVRAVVKSALLSAVGSTTLRTSSQVVSDMYSFTTVGTPLHDAYIGATVYANDGSKVKNLKQAIEALGYSAQTSEDLMGFLFTFVNVLMSILIGFGALAIITSVFGIINTQYISVLERTQQIGLMKALGMRRRDVGRLFMLEAAWIGFLGGALGSGLALLVGTLANPKITEALGLGQSHLIIFKVWMFVAVVGGLMLIAVLAGIFPSRKAAKLDPIEALRTE